MEDKIIKLEGDYRRYCNLPEDTVPCDNLLFADLSRRIGSCVGITIKAKDNKFSIEAPANKEEKIISSLNYIRQNFYDVSYKRTTA